MALNQATYMPASASCPPTFRNLTWRALCRRHAWPSPPLPANSAFHPFLLRNCAWPLPIIGFRSTIPP